MYAKKELPILEFENHSCKKSLTSKGKEEWRPTTELRIPFKK